MTMTTLFSPGLMAAPRFAAKKKTAAKASPAKAAPAKPAKEFSVDAQPFQKLVDYIKAQAKPGQYGAIVRNSSKANYDQFINLPNNQYLIYGDSQPRNLILLDENGKVLKAAKSDKSVSKINKTLVDYANSILTTISISARRASNVRYQPGGASPSYENSFLEKFKD